MTFYVNGIKQQKDKKYTLEMIIDGQQESMVRSFLQSVQVVVLSFFPFSGDIQEFGDVWIKVRYQNEMYTIVVKYTDLMESCVFFLLLGVEVIEINSFQNPISQEEILSLITQAKVKVDTQQQEQAKQKQLQEDEQKNIYTDIHLETARTVIPLVFEKITTTMARSSEYMSIPESKQLTRLNAELKKLRLGTNVEKIREVVESIFELVERIDATYFDAQASQSNTIFAGSVVRLTDVDRERERMENVKILKAVGAAVPIKNQDYALFGAAAIYRKFLQKDIIKKIMNFPETLYGMHDIAEFVILIILSILGVYTLFNQIYLFSFNQFGLAYSLMNVGLRGMVVFAARYLRKRNIRRLLLIIAVAILLHYVLMRAVTTNFAL